MPRQIPWGDLSRVPDPRAQEPWQILADSHLRSADYGLSRDGPIPYPWPTVHIGLTPTWGREIVRYDPKAGPCPACCDAALKSGEVCLVCHATAAEAIRWPMQPKAPLRRRVRRRQRAQSGTRTEKSGISQPPKTA